MLPRICTSRYYPDRPQHRQRRRNKSFLLLFLEKEGLAPLLLRLSASIAVDLGAKRHFDDLRHFPGHPLKLLHYDTISITRRRPPGQPETRRLTTSQASPANSAIRSPAPAAPPGIRRTPRARRIWASMSGGLWPARKASSSRASSPIDSDRMARLPAISRCSRALLNRPPPRAEAVAGPVRPAYLSGMAVCPRGAWAPGCVLAGLNMHRLGKRQSACGKKPPSSRNEPAARHGPRYSTPRPDRAHSPILRFGCRTASAV